MRGGDKDPLVSVCIYVSVASQFVILGLALGEATSLTNKHWSWLMLFHLNFLPRYLTGLALSSPRAVPCMFAMYIVNWIGYSFILRSLVLPGYTDIQSDPIYPYNN